MVYDRQDFLEKSHILDVYVHQKKVGSLCKEGARFIFNYDEGVALEDCVSLLMPVRQESYVSENNLHPIFQVNLPEGAVYDLVYDRFGKEAMSDKLSMLALGGGDSVGRVKAVPHGYDLNWLEKPSLDEKTILENPNSDVFFGDILEKMNLGVSGAMPKALVNTEDDRSTVILSRQIFKKDGAEYSGLSINEFLSLKAAKEAGIETPEVQLCKDGKGLLVSRFDVDTEGKYKGFEDFCSLFALGKEDKYKGTLERVNKVAGAFFEDKVGMRKDLVRWHLFNMVIGNTDAHLKNIAVLYDDPKAVKFAPFYDIVSVTSFHDLKNDGMSMACGGKKDLYFSKVLENFILRDCNLHPDMLVQIKEEITTSVKNNIQEVKAYMERYPFFEGVGRSMIVNWEQGCARLEQMGQNKKIELPTVGDVLSRYQVKDEKEMSSSLKSGSIYSTKIG